MDTDGTPPHRNGTIPVMTSHATSSLLQAHSTQQPRPTIADLHDENNFYASTARKYWLSAKNPPKVKQNVVKELWDHVVKDGFRYNDFMLLEMTQILERYDKENWWFSSNCNPNTT